MAVGWQQKPFPGPTPFFGYPQDEMDGGTGMPVPTLPPVGGVGAPVQPQEATQPIFAPRDMFKGGMFGDTPPVNNKQEQAPEGDWPSEDAIGRRRKLAEALMGKQMEVNHPVQAVANAVSQIAGAYVQNRADQDEEDLQKRRQDFFLGALKDGGDFDGIMTQAMGSPDPYLQDMALKYKLAALQARDKKGGRPEETEIKYGDGTAQSAYWDSDQEQWVPYGDRYPRFSKAVSGSGGGGGDTDTQKGGWVYVDGESKYAEFVPGRGMMVRDDSGTLVPIPKGASQEGSMLSPAAFRKEVTTYTQADQALKQLDTYFSTLKSANVGYKRWTDTISAHIKTLLTSGKVPPRYTPEELSLMAARGQLQGLLGLFREDVVGGGVMTEYDALRILQRLGGDVTALQNPQVVEPLLRELYVSKKRTRDTSKAIIDYNAARYPGLELPSATAPEILGGASSQPAGQNQPVNNPPPPPRERTQLSDGGVYTIKGQPMRWDAAKQKFYPVR
jgi:hypothetical protein